MPLLKLGDKLVYWVKEFKYLKCKIKAEVNLKVAVDVNCRKFVSASYAISQRCSELSEEILCQIIFDVYPFCYLIWKRLHYLQRRREVAVA